MYICQQGPGAPRLPGDRIIVIVIVVIIVIIYVYMHVTFLRMMFRIFRILIQLLLFVICITLMTFTMFHYTILQTACRNRPENKYPCLARREIDQQHSQPSESASIRNQAKRSVSDFSRPA